MTAKFIKLNEVYTDKSILPLLLNTAFITSIKTAKQGDTMINMVGERYKGGGNSDAPVYFFVKETIAEVEAML
jgi:hypothetical protein